MGIVPDFIGNSNFISNIKGIVKSVSESPAPVLLTGERGSGKRLFAQHVHLSYSNDFKGFYEINCMALEGDEIKDIIEKIIFTASGFSRSTLYLNNVDSLSEEVQISFNESFLSRLEQKNIKIISSCLTEIQDTQKFNPDLYFKLSVVKLNFPPLRQRTQDILPVAEFYLNKFRKGSGLNFKGFSETAELFMKQYFWKGNCDELINSVQRAFIVGSNELISEDDLGLSLSDREYSDMIKSQADKVHDKTLSEAVNDFKKEYLIKVLEENGWNQKKTPKLL